MKKILVLLTTVALLALAACASKPNDDQIKAALEDSMKTAGISDYYVIKDFTKTNGFEKDAKTYIADVSYIVASKEGVKLSMPIIDKASNFFKILVVAKGMRVTEKITIIKTENGWSVDKRSDGKFQALTSDGRWVEHTN
ncbi:hypothetical protein GTA51_19680 [Desulfovibrio aerotolerans]|uniref:DUF4878 domain-containing protein n=1 Tax=Solidesulfovibrio aerotolerans TaxID=295255 RepID=A0A7C9IQE0_9BACT|nr:hypothetical protein [Solidesulfovibrio aerotolerans]MYL85319.1 hypothetical protein [Solidesulfovibrio aerotolerans]